MSKNTVQISPIDVSLLILRLGAGLTLLYYGSQKMLGAFGGMGFMPTIKAFEEGTGFHPALAICAIFSEFFGSLGLIFGALTRFAAFGVATTMFVAASVHVKDLNLMMHQTYKDFTYPLLIGLMAFVLMMSGGGKYSIDQLFKRKVKAT